MALPKANRLRRAQDFSAVYQRGSRWKSIHLTLRALRQRPLAQRPRQKLSDQGLEAVTASVAVKAEWVKPALPQPTDWPRTTRIGVAVSTKVSKRSVVRNQIKRRIQSILYQHLAQFPTGWDLVVVVHPIAAECDYAGFLQELEHLLMEAEVWNGH